MCDSEIYKLIQPSIEKLNAILPSSIEDTHVMSEDGLPNAEFEFVHDVRREQLPVIDAIRRKAYRERPLSH